MNQTSASLQDLLHTLALAGWRFWVEGDRLRYRAPKSAATAAVLEQLKPHKAAIIELLTAAPDRLDICPLAYGQTALWFLWRLAPASQAYNQSLPLQIAGVDADDATRWRAGCAALATRHPLLRTIFPMHDGQPYQQVLAEAELPWQEHAAGDWEPDQLAAALAAAHAVPFDLVHAPPLRCHWFADATGRGRHILLITLHHIACDGWSLELMRQELNALVEGAPLAAPTFTYHDYVRWQHALLASAEGERLWGFWRNQLAAPLPLLDLPIDHPRPPVQRYDGASCPLALPATIFLSLHALAAAESATLFELLLAAYVLFLHRFTGQDDLLIGVPTAGRSRPEFAAVVGYFVNPCVVRATVSADISFRQLLAEVRQQARQAIAHAEFPFPLLVQRLQPERSPDRSPIFDVSMNFHTRRHGVGAGGAAQLLEMAQADGKFDLTLTMVETDDRLHGALGYNLALLTPATVARWAEAFSALLASIVAQPEASLGMLALHAGAPATRAPILRGLQQPVTAAQMLHRQFAAQAAQHPSAPAVADAVTALTYAELDRRASALAGVLAGLGAGPDVRVAICTGRTVDFCVALLAVLKAGAAYVPLEPGVPAELLAYMIDHAEAAALLTQQALLPELPPVTCPVLAIDAPLPALPVAPLQPAQLAHLAYVMYTSGSTGRPKAVAISHAAVANYTESMRRDLAIDGVYNFLLASTFAADLGNTMIFPALCSGGCLHILPEAARLDPKLFAALMAERAIDYLKIVPSHLAALLGDSVTAAALPRRALVLGGESAMPVWVARIQAAAPTCRIYNHYGPTETTVGVMTHRYAANTDPAHTATLLLSRAVANTDIFLLDANLHTTAPGAVGELYIGGGALARGYLGDAGQPGAGFVQIATDDGELHTLYRTGDLARWRGGALELLGRKDRQVKLRGYRIELAQVEHVLRQAPGVAQAAVITDDDGARATALLAFVVSAAPVSDAGAWLHTVQAHLAEQLPRYMLPASVTPLARLPVTANGKLDTAALRRLEPAAVVVAAGVGRLPHDTIDLQLSQLWADVLELPQVYVTDNFFDLGGHSLLAVRLAAQIEAVFGVWTPLATLLTHPTVAELAPVIRRSGATGRVAADALLIPLHRAPEGAPIILLPGAGGSVLYLSDLARRLGAATGQPVWGLQAIGLTPDQPIPQRVEAIAGQYADLLQQRFPATTYSLLGHSFGALVGYALARQLAAAGASSAPPPIRLGVLDNPAPQPGALTAYAGYDHGDWLLHIATRIGKLNGVTLALTRTELAGLTVDQQNVRLVAQLIRQGLLPAEVTASYFSRFVDVYRANACAAALYHPEGAVAIDLLLVRAEVHDAELGALGGAGDWTPPDPTWGWQALATGRVRVATVPGTHLSMFAPPAVAVLADTLHRWLTDAAPA